MWLADLARIDAIAAAQQQTAEGTHYVEEFIVGVVDAALAAQSALIAAESLGSAACASARCATCRNKWRRR